MRNPQEVVIGIVRRWDQVLVVDRVKDDGIRKSFPSGKVEENENKEHAVIREVYEETWTFTSIEEYVWSRIHPISQKHISYYLLQYESGELSDADEWISAVSWVSISDLTDVLWSDIFEPVQVSLWIL